jgi:hypothetical protein
MKVLLKKINSLDVNTTSIIEVEELIGRVRRKRIQVSSHHWLGRIDSVVCDNRTKLLGEALKKLEELLFTLRPARRPTSTKIVEVADFWDTCWD